MSKVAIQGYAASFHEAAAQKLLSDQKIEIVGFDEFAEVFDAVLEGRADYGVVATENTNYGPISEVRELFAKHKVQKLDSTALKVDQCLLVVPGTAPDEIETVYSHPVALAQCQYFLDTFLPNAKTCQHSDTAGSAADVAKWQDKAKAAIASSLAAKLHNLEVLESGIQTDKRNLTRFVLFKKMPSH